MRSGISISSASISSRRCLRDFFSGDPGAYERTGSLTGAARGKIAFDMRQIVSAAPRARYPLGLSPESRPGKDQEPNDQQRAADGSDRPQPPRPPERQAEHRAAEEGAPQEEAPARPVHSPPRPLCPEEPHEHHRQPAVHEIPRRRLPELELPRLQAGRQRMGPERPGDHRQGAADGADEDPVHGGGFVYPISPSRRTEAMRSLGIIRWSYFLKTPKREARFTYSSLERPASPSRWTSTSWRKMPRSSMSSHRPTTISGPVVSTITVMPCSSPLF